MSLLDRLRRAGERIGVFHAAPAPAAAGAGVKLVPRQTTLAELCAAAAAPAAPAPAWPDADAVQAAVPGTAWSAPRVAELLAGELAGLDADATRAALLARLTADGASAEDVLRDALARDQALDAAAAATLADLRAQAARRRAQREVISERIAALSAERDALLAADAADAARWQAWWARKHALEEGLAQAVRPLVDRALVSVEPTAPGI